MNEKQPPLTREGLRAAYDAINNQSIASLNIDIDVSAEAYDKVRALYESGSMPPIECAALKAKLDHGLAVANFSMISASMSLAGAAAARAMYGAIIDAMSRQRVLLTYGAAFVDECDAKACTAGCTFNQASVALQRQRLLAMCNDIGRQVIEGLSTAFEMNKADAANNRHTRRQSKHARQMKASDQVWKHRRR